MNSHINTQHILPEKAWQLDYQDFGNLVFNHCLDIETFQAQHNLKFNLIVAKSRNGVFPGNIISNYFDIPICHLYVPRGSTIDAVELLATKDSSLILNSSNVNILFVDSICGSGDTVKLIKEFFNVNYKNVNFYSYCTLTDNRSKDILDVQGLISDKFIQPPWEWKSFTPQVSLDRLISDNYKLIDEKYGFIGFSSEKVKEDVEFSLNFKIPKNGTDVYLENKIHSPSKVDSINSLENLSFSDLKGMYNDLIVKKVNFILNSGFTHFISNNLNEIIIISESCPVTVCLYFDGKNLYKVYSKKIISNHLAELNF